MPKFDAVIMNPPWDIHLKIIETALTYVDYVVNISPIRWLQDPLAKYKKNSDYNKFEESISKKIESLDVIDSNTASKLFSAAFNMNLGIYIIGKGGYNYKNCENNIIDRIIDALNGGPTFSRDRYRYFVNNKCINPDRNDVNGLTPEEAKAYNLKTFDNVNVVEFDTADECANFYDYITSPFFIYMCKCHSMDGSVTPKYLPFMEDYKTKRTNDEIFNYFKVSESNKKFIYQELKRLHR